MNSSRWLAVTLFCLLVALPASRSLAADHESEHATISPAVAAEHVEKEEHGLPQAAVHLVDFGPYQVGGKTVGPFAITNSMLVTWVVALLIIICAQVAMRNVREVPEGAQNFWEWLVEGLYGFLETIIGTQLVKKTFWFFATIFIFILFTNWFGVIPGVGTIGWGVPDANGALTHISRPLLRGASADLNMTTAMAIVFFACWTVWALQANGFGGFIMHLFGPKGDTTGLLKVLMVIVFLVVGVLEVVSILFRPVSLSFRLYGNVFAGENILESMTNLSHYWGWLMALPFYFMELLVGVVQALVFMLLTAVFTLLIMPDEKGHH